MYFLALQRLHHSLPTAKLLADADVSCSTALLSSASTSRCVADRVTPQITPSADGMSLRRNVTIKLPTLVQTAIR
jgi:hypothetical protein